MAGEINITRYDANEILHKDDLQYGETRAYENLTSIIKRLSISTNDPIVQGGTVKQRGTPSMNVDIESLLAFCVSTGKFAYYGSDFGPVAIANGGAQARYDLVEIRLKETNFDELQRAYKDPNTGDITYQDWMTKIHYEMEAQIIQGTEGAGVAANHTAGWIKIAEIFVDAAESTSILDADIENVTAGYDTETTANWTAETAVTFRTKAISEIKAIIRTKHNEDGDHNDDVIRDAHVAWGAGAGEVDADLMPLGTTITHNPTGGTAASLTSASVVRAAVQKILDLLIDLSGVENDAVDDRHINWGTAAGQVDADLMPLGTAITHAPTGGTPANLTTASTVRAAVQKILDLLIDLSGVENDAIDDRHINFGTGANQVSAADLPIADSKGKYTSGNAEGALGEVQATKLSAKAANYTILDNDGISVVDMTTGATDKTATLPTAADNTDREITLRKADSAAGKAILDGEGAETINGTATWEVTEQYGYVKVKSNGTTWIVLVQEGCIYEMWDTTQHTLGASWVDYYNLSGISPGKYLIKFGQLLSKGEANNSYATLATAVDIEDDKKYTSAVGSTTGGMTIAFIEKTFIRSFVSITTLYLNAKEEVTGGTILNDKVSGYIRATRIG